MEHVIFPYKNDNVIEKRDKIKDIPILRFFPVNSVKLPTIIYYHGWSSNKNFQRFKASIYALYGYHVIVPDSVNHGVRGAVDFEREDALDSFFWKTILKSVDESLELLKGIRKFNETDNNRIGLAGSSMGGFIGSGIFIKNSDFKTFISFNGSCSWVETNNIYKKESNKFKNSDKYLEKIKNFDPINNLTNLNNRPLLMIHGDVDTSVPLIAQKNFYAEAKKYYKNNKKIELYEVPGVDHHITINMIEKAIRWLKKYL